MTLKEYAYRHNNYIDIDVSDSVYDVLGNFTYDFLEKPEDNYNKFMNLLGENVIVNNNLNDEQLVCNFFEFFEKHNKGLKELFEDDNISERLTLNIDNILSGNCSETYYNKLYESLEKSINNENDMDI